MRTGQRGLWRAGVALGALTMMLGGGLSANVSQVPIQVTPYASEPGVPTVTVAGPQPAWWRRRSNGSGRRQHREGTLPAREQRRAQYDAGTVLGCPVSEAEAVGVNPSAWRRHVSSRADAPMPGQMGPQRGRFRCNRRHSRKVADCVAADPRWRRRSSRARLGKATPTTEAIAASGYLMQANSALTSAGVTNPTVLDARAYYNFGPNAGVQIAQAPPTALMSDYISSAAMSGNNVSASETVAQWQSSVSSKIGNAASQTVLS